MLRVRYSLLFLLATVSLLADDGDTLYLPPDQINAVLRETPMPELGESKRIERILGRYYEEALGGPENWDEFESLSVRGTLKLEDGDFDLDALQKKPDFLKMTISQLPNRASMVLAYDGELAWQKLGMGASPKPMEPKEARRFAHSAMFGNHLLYPFIEGKKIRYIDTVPVEGAICHQVRVTLDSEYQVDYFIDIRTYLEVKVENTDLQTGARNSVIYKDYTLDYGMPVALKVESFEEGEWVSSLEIDEVRLNSGVMPWMFHMPQ